MEKKGSRRNFPQQRLIDGFKATVPKSLRINIGAMATQTNQDADLKLALAQRKAGYTQDGDPRWFQEEAECSHAHLWR